jgi:Flp pilus assembly pilin Flp
MHIKLKNKRGQSTVEYVLLVTAVIAVIIVMVTSKNSGLQSQLNSTLNSAIGQVGTMSDKLANSETTPPGGGNATAPYSVPVNP